MDEAAPQDQDLKRRLEISERELHALRARFALLEQQYQSLAINAEEQREERREIIRQMRQREEEIRRLRRQVRAGWRVTSVAVSVTGVSVAAGCFLVMRQLKGLRADALSWVIGAGTALLLAVRPHAQRAAAAAAEKMISVLTPMLQSLKSLNGEAI